MNSNTVYDIDFTRALPATLKDDETVNALGRVIAAELQKNIRLSRMGFTLSPGRGHSQKRLPTVSLP